MTSLTDTLLDALRPFATFFDKAMEGFTEGYAERQPADKPILGWNNAELLMCHFVSARAAVALAEQRGEPSELVDRLRFNARSWRREDALIARDESEGDLNDEAADRIEALERELAEAKASKTKGQTL